LSIERLLVVVSTAPVPPFSIQLPVTALAVLRSSSGLG
jgi:hypothetical protein